MHDRLSLVFLIAIVVLPTGWMAWTIWRSNYSFFQYFLWTICRLLVRILWRADVPPLPIQPGQGAVFVSNHRSSADPFFLQSVADRPIHWMVAREFCEHPLFRTFLRACEVIPVGRGGIDTKATKTAIRFARQNQLLGVFPEGRINMTEQLMLPGRPGAILIAIKAGAPIIPVYIEGSPYNQTPWSPLLMRARVRVRFGRAIDVAGMMSGGTVVDNKQGDDSSERGEKQPLGQLLERCMREIARLAGDDLFVPVVAGRNWKPTDAELKEQMQSQGRANRQSSQ